MFLFFWNTWLFAGSTIKTLLHEKINPKDRQVYQVLSVGDVSKTHGNFSYDLMKRYILWHYEMTRSLQPIRYLDAKQYQTISYQKARFLFICPPKKIRRCDSFHQLFVLPWLTRTNWNRIRKSGVLKGQVVTCCQVARCVAILQGMDVQISKGAMNKGPPGCLRYL